MTKMTLYTPADVIADIWHASCWVQVFPSVVTPNAVFTKLYTQKLPGVYDDKYQTTESVQRFVANHAIFPPDVVPDTADFCTIYKVHYDAEQTSGPKTTLKFQRSCATKSEFDEFVEKMLPHTRTVVIYSDGRAESVDKVCTVVDRHPASGLYTQPARCL